LRERMPVLRQRQQTLRAELQAIADQTNDRAAFLRLAETSQHSLLACAALPKRLSQRQRKKVEALFAELKNQIGLRRLRLRRMKFVREQFFLAAAAQNIKRLVRFLCQPPTPTVLTS